MRVTRWLPLDAIRMDRYPFTGVLPLVDFLRNQGTVKPIHVQKIDGDPDFDFVVSRGQFRFKGRSGHYKILDGRHRWMAYKLLGRTHIEVTYGIPDTKEGQKTAA